MRYQNLKSSADICPESDAVKEVFYTEFTKMKLEKYYSKLSINLYISKPSK